MSIKKFFKNLSRILVGLSIIISFVLWYEANYDGADPEICIDIIFLANLGLLLPAIFPNED